MGLAAGATVAPFAATAVDGERVGSDALLADTIVGFFSPQCKPCEERVPLFIAAAADAPNGRRQAIAVLSGPADDSMDDYVTRLGRVARVVAENHDGALHRAFGVMGVPATCRVDADGTILASGTGALTARRPVVVAPVVVA